MIRTSKADSNLFSVSANTFQWFAGTPDVKQADGIPNPTVFTPKAAEAPSYIWATMLKVCDGTHSVVLNDLHVAQGDENALDCNNGVADCQLVGAWGEGGGTGQQVITVKGGCRNLRIWGIIYSKGLNADYVQDAWADQSQELCSRIDLSALSRADGQPVTIILGRFGSSIEHYPASYRVLFWKSLGYKLYWLGKRAAVKLGLIKGVK